MKNAMIIIIILTFLIIIIDLVSGYKCFLKADIDGWKALIPFYNKYMYCMIATGDSNLSWTYVILSGIGISCNLISRVSLSELAIVSSLFSFISAIILLCIGIKINYRFAKAYGKSEAFSIAYIFFSTILGLIIAFDTNTQYIGPIMNNGENTSNDKYRINDNDNIETETSKSFESNYANVADINEFDKNNGEKWDWFFK